MIIHDDSGGKLVLNKLRVEWKNLSFFFVMLFHITVKTAK